MQLELLQQQQQQEKKTWAGGAAAAATAGFLAGLPAAAGAGAAAAEVFFSALLLLLPDRGLGLVAFFSSRGPRSRGRRLLSSPPFASPLADVRRTVDPDKASINRRKTRTENYDANP